MKLRNLALLFTVLILMACNQSDSTNETQPADNTKADNIQSESTMNDNTSAVEAEPEREGKVVARVNGQPIYEDDVIGKDLDFIITEETIYQDAIKRGADKEYRNEVKKFERNLIIRKTKQKILENTEPTKKISDEEIQEYYEANKDKYSHVRIQEISSPDVNLGLEIKEKAQNGEDLQDIATSYPDIAITVTDIGYNRELAQKFKSREVGSISEVIQKPNGTFSVLKIVDMKEIPLNTVKSSIQYNLEALRIRDMFEIHAKRLAEENNITIEIIE